MIRSLLAPFCIAPILIAGLLHLPIAMLWAGCAAIVLLSFVLAHPQDTGVETGAASLGIVLLHELMDEGVDDDLPLYLAGVHHGVTPATDWYTAVVDGQHVLVLETVEMAHAQ